MGMHQNDERRRIGRLPRLDVLASGEVGALEGLAVRPALAKIGVDRQPLARQLPRLAPPPTGGFPLLTPVLPATEDRHPDDLASLLEGPLDHRPQLLGKLVAWDEDGSLRVDTGLVVLGDWQTKPILPLLLSLVADCAVDRLSRLAETGRAFDEQPADVLAVLALEPPEEKPLNDLAQLLLGFLSGEEGRAGGWRQAVQGGPRDREGRRERRTSDHSGPSGAKTPAC